MMVGTAVQHKSGSSLWKVLSTQDFSVTAVPLVKVSEGCWVMDLSHRGNGKNYQRIAWALCAPGFHLQGPLMSKGLVLDGLGKWFRVVVSL